MTASCFVPVVQLDRIPDSGSGDTSSTLVGDTKKNILPIVQLGGFFYANNGYFAMFTDLVSRITVTFT